MTTSEVVDARDGSGGYLEAVSRHRFLIGALVIAFVGLSIVLSVSQEKKYQASTIILFQDPNEDLSLLGTSGGVFRTAQQRAQIGADTMVDDALATEIKSRLHLKLSIKAIKDDLSASADPASSQVTVTATATTPALAKSLADTASQVEADSERNDARNRYSTAAENLRTRSKKLGNSSEDVDQRIELGQQITRLLSLSELAQPVDITKPATLPTSPASPKPVANAILALFLALVIGVIVVLVREAFDRRIVTLADVEEVLDLPVLASFGAAAMGCAGGSELGAGPLPEADQEAFRILRTSLRLHRIDDPPKTILVTSAMPSEGKSTVAAGLAASYAAAGDRTVLVECDFRRPSLAGRLGTQQSPGLIDFLIDEAAPGDIVQAVPDAVTMHHPHDEPRQTEAVATAVSNVPLASIMAGSRPNIASANLLETDRFREFIDEITDAYDHVIIDSPPLLAVADTLAMLPYCDAILLCVRGSQTTRDQARNGYDALDAFQDKVAGVAVTGLSRRERSDYGYYAYEPLPDGPAPDAPSGRRLFRRG